MKKFNLTFTVILAVGLLIFFGCSKDSNQYQEKQNDVFQPTEKDLEIESKILEFESKIAFAKANPDLKSGGDDLSIDEAVWNIEALANYNYSDASNPFDIYEGETAEIEVPLTNGKITLLDAGIAYDKAIDSLALHFSQVSGTDKKLVLADVTLKEIGEESATFDVTSSIGSGDSSPFADFGEDDWWEAILLDGKCDGSGQGVGSDAAEKIEYKIDKRLSLPSDHRYFTDISVLEFNAFDYICIYLDGIYCEDCSIINPDDDIPNDNMYDYIIYRSHSYLPNHHTCLIPNEMNFYLDGMEHLIYDLAYQWFPYDLEGKIFASCNIIGELYMGGYQSVAVHEGYIHYGVSVGSGNPPPHDL